MSAEARKGPRSRYRLYDWDAIAGIFAACAALVLHLLHVIETDVLLTIALVAIALLLFRDLRREAHPALGLGLLVGHPSAARGGLGRG